MNRQFRIFAENIKNLGEKPSDKFPAMLGNKSGVVKVSGDVVNIITIPEGMPMQVINRTVPNRPGDVVMVGKREGSNSLEVLYSINGNSSIPVSDENVISTLPEHAKTHQYPSYDTVFIKNLQFLPLLALPVTDYTVRVFPGTVAKRNASGYVHTSGNTALDLSPYVPASGACWCVIQVEDDGTISADAGTTLSSRTLLTGDNVHVVTYTPIWAIILDSNYAELEASNYRNDFFDLRFAVTVPTAQIKYRALMWEEDPGGGWHFMWDADLPNQPLYDLLETE